MKKGKKKKKTNDPEISIIGSTPNKLKRKGGYVYIFWDGYGEDVPGEEGVLIVERVWYEALGAEVDSDRAGVRRAEVVDQNPIFQSQDRAGVGAMQSLGALRHRLVKNCQHFPPTFLIVDPMQRERETERVAACAWLESKENGFG